MVQRLRRVIYRLPSAETMGTWRPARVRRTAHAYADRMRRLGVRMDLAPVADLELPGGYIAAAGPGLRPRPRPGRPDGPRLAARHAGRRRRDVAQALARPRRAAGDSHTRPGAVPRLSVLEGRDLVPFERELADGAPVVMVGHLLSRRADPRRRPDQPVARMRCTTCAAPPARTRWS